MQIDWSNQQLTTEQLSEKLNMFLESEQSLVSLDISDNVIVDLTPLYAAMASPYVRNTLKILNISANKLTEVAIDDLPGLFAVDLSYNPSLTQISIYKANNLKTIDLTKCSIDDQTLLAILISGIRPMQLKLTGNPITDIGIEVLIQNPEAVKTLSSLTSMDLGRTQCTKYQNIMQVKRLFTPAAASSKLPAVRPLENRSKTSSARSAASAILTSKSLINKLDELAVNKTTVNFPQLLADVLVGSHSRIYMDMNSVNCAAINSGSKDLLKTEDIEDVQVCKALIVGIKVHQELEDNLAFGFARKVGSIHCKNYKTSSFGCRERCVNILTTIQKKIDEQMAKKGTYATSARMDLGKSHGSDQFQ